MGAMTLTSVTTKRLEEVLRRVFSLTVLLSTSEVVANAFAQADLLDGSSYLLLAGFLASVIAATAASWFGAAGDIWFWIHGVLSMLIVLLWPWIVKDATALSANYQPWIWWGLGMAAISIGIVANLKITLAYLIANSSLWFLVDTSEYGGSSDAFVSFQDSAYIFLFSGAVIGLVQLVREGARRADEANSALIEEAIAEAQEDAVQRERQRIDALVHDRVLNTLILAANADSEETQLAAQASAQQAITSLRQAEQALPAAESVTPIGLFRALRRVASKVVPEVKVEASTGGTGEIPANVAQALTEATLQALDNSARHAKAKSITLKLEAPHESEILITVTDDGVGFRLDRISRDRIGIKTSILARLESVGGSATVLSSPETGTKVTLRWAR